MCVCEREREGEGGRGRGREKEREREREGERERRREKEREGGRKRGGVRERDRGEREREREIKIKTLELSFPSFLCLLPFFSLPPLLPLLFFLSLLLFAFSSFPLTSFPESNQSKIVDCGVMEVLVPLLDSRESEIVTAAIAALRNLSIKKGNEVSVSWV